VVRVFVGVDPRQPIAFHVLCSSIMRRASVPVSITPLVLFQLPIDRCGLTEFTFSRYLVPYLCNYEGQAIFMDSDMLVVGDVAELSTDEAVSCVHHQGHEYEAPSMMVFDNAKCRELTPEYIEQRTPQTFEWAESVGALDPNWNFLVGYEEPREGIKLLHYTQGIPEYKECRKCDFADVWFQEKDAMLHAVSWIEIMGQSRHVAPVLDKLRVG